MIRTEEEARKCWCPFGLTPHYARDTNIATAVAANRAEQSFEDDIMGRPESPLPTCACIASKCMAWRWAVTDTQSGWVVTRPGNTEPEKDLWGWNPVIDPSTYREGFKATKYVPKVTHGYCGLAGKP